MRYVSKNEAVRANDVTEDGRVSLPEPIGVLIL